MDFNNEQLERLIRLTEENNRILKGMRTRERMSSFMKAVYIALFIYASYWAYVKMQPYLAQLQTLTQQVIDLNKTTSELGEAANNAKGQLSPDVVKLLDKLPK